jgi:hypothetical protein
MYKAIAFSFSFGLLLSSTASAQDARGALFDPSPGEPLQEFEKVDPKVLPASLDNSRLFGAPKSQGSCGSCAVFASTGLLESTFVRDAQLFVGATQLSEQLTIDCAAPQFPDLCQSGSYVDAILSQLTSTGTMSSTAVPYTANALYKSSLNACVSALGRSTSSNYAFRSSQYVKLAATSVGDIKQAINTYGGVVATLYVTESFTSYTQFSPPITMQACRNPDDCGGHAVVLLGWDDSQNAFYGRNSWGTWGRSGYFYISYNEVSRYSVSGLAVRENGVYVIRSASIPYNFVAPADPLHPALTVAKSGSGAGTVSSSVGAISCGTQCTDTFPVNSTVDLIATPSANSDFGSWLGRCQAGTPSNVCRVNLTAQSVVFANFVARPTSALDPAIVGIVGADFATRFASTAHTPTLALDGSTGLTAEISRIDNVVVPAGVNKLLIDRPVLEVGRYDRETTRDQFTLVYAKQMTIDTSLRNGELTVTHPPVVVGVLDGLNGAKGPHGADGGGEVNRTGLPGQQGGQGQTGQTGKSLQYPQFVLAVEKFVWSDGSLVAPGTLSLRFDFSGMRGGSGGNGGIGGDGGNGAPGKEGATGLFGCLEGGGSGGAGGDGGVGGLPGAGGDGGNGADVFAFTGVNQLQILNSASLNLDGSPGGGGGHGGDSGNPGSGGAGAPSNGYCSGTPGGPPGTKPIANLGIGAAGADGLVGSYAPYALRQLSTIAAEEPPVIEYVNTADFPNSPGGHFFYTNSPDDIAFVDSGIAGKFNRTGSTFNAGGTQQLCRFYGSVAPGPNSHFFSILDRECLLLQSLQVVPTPSDVQQWNYEGLTFSETPANTTFDGIPTSCPSPTVPVYRYYNNAYSATGRNAWDSNHRYGTDKGALDAFAAANGWSAEGIAFCARP